MGRGGGHTDPPVGSFMWVHYLQGYTTTYYSGHIPRRKTNVLVFIPTATKILFFLRQCAFSSSILCRHKQMAIDALLKTQDGLFSAEKGDNVNNDWEGEKKAK